MKRIALVEDNPDNRLLVQAMIGDRYDIDEYESGNEAIAGLGRQLADLALLDISLPGMDGVEVLQRLRADPRTAGMPVIALTAHAMAGDRERFLEAGFNGYITKPILDDAALVRAIEQLSRSVAA
jgi:CheY-like chemotaxis protein